MKKALLSAAACLLVSPTVVHADMLGFFVGAGVFDAEFSGSFKNTGNLLIDRDIDVANDLGLDDSAASYVYVAFEHPVPLIPNIKLARTELDQDGSSTLTNTIEFDGQVYAANTALDSKIDLSHTDATLYYEILDNWVNLDLGLTLRKYDGEVAITGVTQGTTQIETAQQDIDFTIPLFYAKAQFDLPFTGLYVAADGNWIGCSGNMLFDATGKIGYEASIGFGVEAGIRSMAVELDDKENLEADLEFSGLFLAAYYHF